MLKKCPNCGGSGAEFINLIEAAIKENKNFIKCPYCKELVEFRKRDLTTVEHGYEYLAIGAFELALECFDKEIKFSERHGKTPSADTYLGKALAEFNVQVEYEEDYAARDVKQRPRLTCQHYNKEYFCDNVNFRMACDVIDCEFVSPLREKELEWFDYYAKTIDDIKDYYDQIAKREGGKPYNLFIAYDDDQTDIKKAKKYSDDAIEVYNDIPSKEIKNKFMANPNKRDDDRLFYEAEILYALEHSNCMLVVVEDDIGPRLRNIYTRFYGVDKKKDRNLAFVRMVEDSTPIVLPDHHNADEDHIFELELGKRDRDLKRMVKFVYLNNGIIVEDDEEEEKDAADEVEENIERSAESGECSGERRHRYYFLDPKHVAFGYYPQKREEARDVLDYFEGFGLPNRREYHEWKVLFINKKGQPTWYRDEEVNGKRYRAIYFDGFRDLYSVQDSDVAPSAQTAHHYGRKELYCFSFEPLVWVVEKKSPMQLTLVSESGIDAHEYTDDDSMSNEWADSSIRRWLNDEFLHSAFSENDEEILCSYAGDEEKDKIYLLDKDIDKEFYQQDIVAMRGTDYYQCVGGRGEDSTVEKYWINDRSEEKSYDEASVVTPKHASSSSTDYVDSTGVAVLPKIIITRDEDDEEED